MKCRKITFLFFLLLPCLLGKTVLAQTALKKDISQYVWDLSYIYPSKEAWDKDLKLVQTKLSTVQKHKGLMQKNAGLFLQAMDDIYDIRSRAAKMMLYAMLQSYVNTKDEQAGSMTDAAGKIEIDVESAVSFLPDEIKKIGAEKVNQWVKSEPKLQRHTRRINRILQEIPYTSSQETQAVIESMKGWPGVTADGFFALYDSELNWPVYVDKNNNPKKITYGEYAGARRTTDAQERLNVARAMLGFSGSYENLLGFLYTKRITADLTISKHKKFNDGIDALWFLRDGIPPGTYKLMIETAKENKHLLTKYSVVLKQILGAQEVGYQDFYGSSKSTLKNVPIADGWDIILKTFAPLGKAFIDTMKSELAKPTMHLVPLPNKRTFYANQMPIGGIPSYSMMTYNGSYANLKTLATIAARKVRIKGIPAGNWPDTRDDPPSYGNGMLYVAEMMFDDYLIQSAPTKEEKIYHLHNALFRLWRHNFCFVIDAELDAKLQEMVINNVPPGGAKISATYMDILKEYYQDIPVDPVFAKEWTVNALPFLSYEGHFWPVGMAAACLLYDQLKAGDTKAAEAMRTGLMGKGKLDLSYDMFKSVGIDVSQKKTYQAMYNRMNYLLDEVSKLLK